MNKKIAVLFFIFISSSIASAEKPFFSQPFCEKDLYQNDNLQIKSIDVKIKKYRKWTENGIRIITGNFRWIPDKYKKRFKADIIVEYENSLKCSFQGSVRHNGDQKDHIKLIDNSIIQSLDIHLKTGHIYGITKFKLLLNNTRGVFEDEIFLTTMLRKLNYLAPRTMYLNAKINNVSAKMIFQEKAVKEMLEYNLRREGPIYEGDERFLFSLAKDIPDNNLSNWSIGMVPLLESGVNAMLAKQVNTKLIFMNEMNPNISFNALSNLNLIYLLYSNMYKNEKNNFFYSDYTLSNELLGFYQPDKILKLDAYNLLMNSANASHGLAANNRKYYWNSFGSYFEPVNYDSNANFSKKPSMIYLPLSRTIEDGFIYLENLLGDIDIVSLNAEINFSGIKENINTTELKINLLQKNLKLVKKLFQNHDQDLITYNNKTEINESMWTKYLSALNKINTDIMTVRQIKKKEFEVCDKSLNCKNTSFNTEEMEMILDGSLVLKGIDYQYLGNKISKNNLTSNLNYNHFKFGNSHFYYDSKIDYLYNEEKNEFNVYQMEPGARAFFIKGKLKDVTINLYGNHKNEKLNNTPKNFPVDINSLTACLSFIDMEVENINLNATNSTCEDSINLINVKGKIDEVNIRNSFLDGLDIDFSNIEIHSVMIDNAKNDCLDVSAGSYKFDILNLSNCGDKGVSVGEKSNVIIKKAKINSSSIGIASKDSSITELSELKLKDMQTCVSAYNKKQEYSGAFLKVNTFECRDFVKKLDVDKYSKIFIDEEL
jgi:hypothetical protein